MDCRKFWTMCRIHDWHYEYSDDPEVYRNGRDGQEELERLARDKPELQDMLNQWRAFHFESGPRPKEPALED